MRSEPFFTPCKIDLRRAAFYTLPLFFSPLSMAAPVNGGSQTIQNPWPIESWALTQNATLTVNGAETLGITSDSSTLNVNAGSTVQQISAGNGSVVNLTDATVNGVSGLGAVSLVNSEANISGSTVTSNRIGLRATRSLGAQTGSTANVTGSRITGVTGGAFATSFSKMNFTDTVIEGTGATSYGVTVQSAQVSAQGGSITGGANGVVVGIDPTGIQPASLSLDDVTVQGKTGSAILVDFANAPNTTATLSLTNSRLLAGNGTLLEVKGGADTAMTVDRSALTGNIVSDSGSNTRLTLQNGSSLTGQLVNVATANINSGSQWTLVDNSQVGNLNLNGGSIRFGGEQAFYQLNVTNLSGNGRFEMGTDFATGQTDLLNVTGQAQGQHELLIHSSGVDPAAGQPIRVVQTAGGDAQFALVNGPVDLGTFSYGLSKVGNDWILDPSTRTVSPGTRSVLALFNTAPTVWYGELTSLRSRMGELRFNGGQSGGWGRVYGNKYNVSDGSGVGYRQTQQGFSLGADAPLPLGDGQWLIGLMAGHSESDLDLKQGTSGTVDSYYLGTYVTWLDAASGYYFDGVLKANRFRNDAKASLSDGARAKGDYDNHGVGGSVEFGRHLKLDQGYFIEPFTQWSAVVIQGKDFSLNNGMQAQGDQTRSLLGKVGMTVGRDFALDDGTVIQPYLRGAWAHEFSKSNEVQVNNNVFNNDLSGSRAEWGAGVAASVTENLQVHADFDYSNGKHIEQPFGANIGLRYSW